MVQLGMVKSKSKSAKISKTPKKSATEKPKFNITKHVLVPKHRIMSKKEVEQLLKNYHISIHQLPLIKEKDVVVKEINAEVGDIIEITRDGPTKGYLFFRRVVE